MANAGLDDKQKGSLVIGDTTAAFKGQNGETVFAVPLDSITDVTNQADVRDASFGKKLLLGGFAGTRKQDFVTITYESPTMAEGLVFRVKDGVAPGVVAKVKFAIKRRYPPPVVDTSATHSTAPHGQR